MMFGICPTDRNSNRSRKGCVVARSNDVPYIKGVTAIRSEMATAALHLEEMVDAPITR